MGLSSISEYFRNPTNDLLEQQAQYSRFVKGPTLFQKPSSSSTSDNKLLGKESFSELFTNRWSTNPSVSQAFDRFRTLDTNTGDYPPHSEMFPNADKSPNFPTSGSNVLEELESKNSSSTAVEASSQIEDVKSTMWPVSSGAMNTATDAVKGASLLPSEGSTLPTLAVGSALSAASSQITESGNNQRILAAQQGNGPEGHAFDAVSHAQMINNSNTNFSNFRSTAIGLGSAFGPLGLAAGSAVAAASIPFQQPVNLNTTMSTGGYLTTASQAVGGNAPAPVSPFN